MINLILRFLLWEYGKCAVKFLFFQYKLYREPISTFPTFVFIPNFVLLVQIFYFILMNKIAGNQTKF